MPPPSDWGTPKAWVVRLPALRLGLGAPQVEFCFLHQTADPLSEFFCIGWRRPELFAAAFAPLPALGSLREPLSLVTLLPFLTALIPTPGLHRPRLPQHPQLSPCPHPHRSAKEPVRTRGSSGTSLREPPSPGCPTQRGPWKVGGALPSTLGWPGSTHPSDRACLPHPLLPLLTSGPDSGL